MSPFSFVQPRFLETTLVRQANDKLKNVVFLFYLNHLPAARKYILCASQQRCSSHIFVRTLLEACTQNLLNTENLTARLEGSILRNGVLTKLAQRYLDWVRDHPLKTSALFPDCLTPPSPRSAFFTSICCQISRNFDPFPLPNCLRLLWMAP